MMFLSIDVLGGNVFDWRDEDDDLTDASNEPRWESKRSHLSSHLTASVMEVLWTDKELRR